MKYVSRRQIVKKVFHIMILSSVNSLKVEFGIFRFFIIYEMKYFVLEINAQMVATDLVLQPEK